MIADDKHVIIVGEQKEYDEYQMKKKNYLEGIKDLSNVVEQQKEF